MLSTSRAFMLGVAVVALAAGCAAIRQQKAEGARADQGEFHNLKVLPQNITHDQLLATMRTFARSLGVKCDHCHVPLPEGSKERFDFANDAKAEKQAARMMLRMTSNVNGQYISTLHDPTVSVSCYTCHRGKSVPDAVLPPEAP
jgi:Photosynthetic reaction centre cytochrome C subunit